ncbi:unnamed protein product [Phytomonas sp. EM1]|nr:unnamed protein product [Phytomonas sp. EM1]|eukprot:CCW63798.1 unnamed protein product [Phytomonas sp. isolate EM1]
MLLIPQRHLSELMLWRCDPPARFLCFLGRRLSVNSRLGIFRESRALLKNSVLSGSFYPSPNHAPAPFPRVHPTNEAKGGIILPTRRGNTAAFAVSDASQTFWTMPVKQTPVEELSRSHLRDRMVDKRSRFAVRRRLREDGVVSNLFPLFFSSASDANARDTHGAFLYVYDICATRRPYQNFDRSSALALPSHVIARRRVKAKQSLTSPPLGSDDGVEIRRVPPMNAWNVIRRFFNHFFSKSPPPMIQHVYKLYTIAPLPAKALKVPPEFYDLGWKNCELRFIAKLRYEDLNPHCLQQVINKIVFWTICNTPALQEGEENENDPNNNSSGSGYRVVRERGGKLVNLAGGISSCGARLFSGVTAQAIFVDASDSEPSLTDPQTTTGEVEVVIAAPNSTDLATLPEGTTPTGRPIRFLAKSFLRAFTYKGREVESYTIEDASGAYLASFWEPPSPRPLQPGRVYTATALHVRIFPSRDHLRLFEFLPGRTTVTAEAGEGGGRAATRHGGGSFPFWDIP